jgi:hypothetical protein
MGAALYAVQLGWRVDLAASRLPQKSLYLVALFLVAAGTYALFAHLLKVRELRLVLGILKLNKGGRTS